jgi:hypothetical protein
VELYWLLLGTLAVWRVTHLFAAEDGPWLVVARLRRRAGAGFLGQLLDCFNCLSLWIAAPVAWLIGEGWKERTLLWLAASGGAIVLERATVARESDPPAAYHEDLEDVDGMLRKE